MEIDESSAGDPPWMTAGGPGGSGSAAARRPHSHGMADLIGTGSADRDIDKVTGFVLSHRFFFSSDYWIYFSCSMVSVAQSSFFFCLLSHVEFCGWGEEITGYEDSCVCFSYQLTNFFVDVHGSSSCINAILQ